MVGFFLLIIYDKEVLLKGHVQKLERDGAITGLYHMFSTDTIISASFFKKKLN